MTSINEEEKASIASVKKDESCPITIDEKSSAKNNKAESHAIQPQNELPQIANTAAQQEEENAIETTYLSPKELSLLTTAFSIATFMIAIDGSILGMSSVPQQRKQDWSHDAPSDRDS